MRLAARLGQSQQCSQFCDTHLAACTAVCGEEVRVSLKVLFVFFFFYGNMLSSKALENVSSLSRKGGGNFHGIVGVLRSGFFFQFPV